MTSRAPGNSLASLLMPTQNRRTVMTYTITDLNVLRKDLNEARRRGYAVNRRESEVGVISVAAPIRDATGRSAAAISVAGPIDRLEPDELRVAQATMETAALISRRLGFRGSIGAA